MGSILEKITEAIKEMLIGMIESNLTNMFTDVNDKVGTIASEVGRTPSAWNSGIYTMIRGLSENVIVPIAGIIITFVLCYELISMITEKNNMHEMDTWMFFKWFFKAAVAIYLVTNTFDIVMAVFDIGQNVVAGAAGVIHGNTSIDIQAGFTEDSLYLFLSNTNMSPIVTGAAQPKINQANLKSFPITIPDSEVLDRFNSIVYPLFDRKLNNEKEIRKLETLRELLLK